ncbi:hypothetical protein [Elizabethkingia anophelis]|uniref:hypothetical protein n=1 Tax=Elizabethkingia anophelis TaxID=1117645 RepID=UPI0002437AB8|nr:hypothetical protein [Elizabethkingia anophelis]ATC39593.1 hypothetical protein EAAG1_006895 [Elizabethkingia anophelis Ag1]ATC43272.1 hypothetical protein CMV41_06895 [Elizabethkingia anophelis]ATC46948.1 hypothetical protein CMV40_06895 [Elizabethkingia anophelis]MCQ0429391.1 hypothetical protein [Elizabethkingia anophelis]
MSKTFKNVFAAAAFGIFNTHKGIDLIHVTSDGQGFTKDNKNKAHDHARYLKDDRVETFERGFEDTYTEMEETDALEVEEDIEPDTTDVQKTEQTKEEVKQDVPLTGDGIEPAAAEKNALISQYKELYGVAPVHNISLEKLKAKIEEKKSADTENKEPEAETTEQKEATEDKRDAEQLEA